MKRYRHDPNVPSHLRDLVESARADDLDEKRRRRVAERLGIASVLGPPSERPRDSSPASARVPVSLGGIALTAIALIGASIVYVAVSHQSPAESPRATVSPAAPPPPPTSIVEPPAAPVTEPSSMPSVPSVPSMHVGALRDAPSERAPIAKPTSATEPGPKGETGDLRLEIAALDSVRQATEGGRPQDALALLDDYAAKFPAGKLREEALVLRIEALQGRDRAGAERLAHQLLRNSPDTPYAARVRSVLDKPAPLHR